MDRPRILRLLRIAVSVVCLVLCIPIGMFWIEMYNDSCGIRFPIHGSTMLSAEFYRGRTALVLWNQLPTHSILWQLERVGPPDRGLLGFDVVSSSVGSGRAVVVPYWFAVAGLCVSAAYSWLQLPKCFSLRTLLIATTLVAIVLGLAVAFG